MSNMLKSINTILEAMGAVPYYIDRLAVADILSMKNYSVGVENLVKNLERSTVDFNYSNYLGVNVDDHSVNLLYRGSSNKGVSSFLFTPGERVAQGTSNVYTKLISDILPSWQNIPKRSNSVICSNDYYEAARYTKYGERTQETGRVYVVIPPNNARMVVSPVGDVWNAFRYLLKNVSLIDLETVNINIVIFLEFFYYIINENLLSDISFLKSKDITEIEADIQDKNYHSTVENIFYEQDTSVILDLFKGIDQVLADEETRDVIIPICKNYIARKMNLGIGNYIFKEKILNNTPIIEILDDLFNPRKNGFVVMPYLSFIKKMDYDHDREVWTDKPCIFIDTDDRKFLTELYHGYHKFKRGNE